MPVKGRWQYPIGNDTEGHWTPAFNAFLKTSQFPYRQINQSIYDIAARQDALDEPVDLLHQMVHPEMPKFQLQEKYDANEPYWYPGSYYGVNDGLQAMANQRAIKQLMGGNLRGAHDALYQMRGTSDFHPALTNAVAPNPFAAGAAQMALHSYRGDATRPGVGDVWRYFDNDNPEWGFPAKPIPVETVTGVPTGPAPAPNPVDRAGPLERQFHNIWKQLPKWAR